jgi:hypothetical protein
MRPTIGDEVLAQALKTGSSAHDVLRAFVDDPQIVDRVQTAMDDFDNRPPGLTGDKAEAIRTALVEVLSEEYAS